MHRSEGVKRKVSKLYDNIHEQHDPTREKGMSKLTNLLLNNLEIPENPTILDLGCGSGYSTFELARHCNYTGDFHGVDISPTSIRNAVQSAKQKEISNISFHIGDVEELRFPESTFDIVLSNMCFQFIQDKKRALSEAYRVLRPRGLVGFLYPGYLQYYEARELLIKVVRQYVDNPEVLLAVRENDRLLIDLEESERLFSTVGFVKRTLYGIHSFRYAEPDWFIDSKSGTWSFWKVGLSQRLVDKVHKDLLVETKKKSSENGFKLTSYLIHATGTKSRG
jgi:ubiquinone/menaquinone biosynthesis C-methylase UbiE